MTEKMNKPVVQDHPAGSPTKHLSSRGKSEQSKRSELHTMWRKKQTNDKSRIKLYDTPEWLDKKMNMYRNYFDVLKADKQLLALDIQRSRQGYTQNNKIVLKCLDDVKNLSKVLINNKSHWFTIAEFRRLHGTRPINFYINLCKKLQKLCEDVEIQILKKMHHVPKLAELKHVIEACLENWRKVLDDKEHFPAAHPEESVPNLPHFCGGMLNIFPHIFEMINIVQLRVSKEFTIRTVEEVEDYSKPGTKKGPRRPKTKGQSRYHQHKTGKRRVYIKNTDEREEEREQNPDDLQKIIEKVHALSDHLDNLKSTLTTIGDSKTLDPELVTRNCDSPDSGYTPLVEEEVREKTVTVDEKVEITRKVKEKATNDPVKITKTHAAVPAVAKRDPDTDIVLTRLRIAEANARKVITKQEEYGQEEASETASIATDAPDALERLDLITPPKIRRLDDIIDDGDFNLISPLLDRSYFSLGIALGLSHSRMEMISAGSRDIERKAKGMLASWKVSKGEKATWRLLFNALRKESYYGIIEELQSVLFPFATKYGGAVQCVTPTTPDR